MPARGAGRRRRPADGVQHQQGRRGDRPGLHLRRPRRADDDPLRPAGEPRRAAGAVGGEPARPGHDRRAGRTSPAGSSCSTSGAPGAAPAARRLRTCSSSRSRRPRTGCRCSASTCATTAPPPPTSSATAASPTTPCSTRPARTLAALRGYPRNTVPSTIVLDRQHRVAAVYLTTIRVPELIPLVQRLAAEPAP